MKNQLRVIVLFGFLVFLVWCGHINFSATMYVLCGSFWTLIGILTLPDSKKAQVKRRHG